MAETINYIDDATPANYMGGYGGDHGKTIPAEWSVASSAPPIHNDQTTDDGGISWSAYP